MAYPTSLISYTTKNTGDIVQAADCNNVQTEVVSIETGLLSGFQHIIFPLTDATYDLAKPTLRFKNFYSDALQALDVASRSNYVTVTAAITGAAPAISTSGASDATINLLIGTKGGTQLKLIDVASLVNFLQYAGTATGTDPTLSVQGDATRNLILSLPGTAALLPRADNVTAIGSATSGMSKIYLRGTGGQIRFDDTSIMGLTEKVGSAGGNYTTTAAVADVDGTNLAFTVTIPTGWKLDIVASSTVWSTVSGDTFSIYLYDGATSLDQKEAITAAANQQLIITNQKTIAGDGASHVIKLRWSRDAGTGTITMWNSAAATAPKMRFLLMPSN